MIKNIQRAGVLFGVRGGEEIKYGRRKQGEMKGKEMKDGGMLSHGGRGRRRRGSMRKKRQKKKTKVWEFVISEAWRDKRRVLLRSHGSFSV